jgi:hypothetical protein
MSQRQKTTRMDTIDNSHKIRWNAGARRVWREFVNAATRRLLVLGIVEEVAMAQFSPRSIETLIDLVEIKLSCLDVMDREDREELKALQRSLAELQEYRRAELPGRRPAGARPSQAALA